MFNTSQQDIITDLKAKKKLDQLNRPEIEAAARDAGLPESLMKNNDKENPKCLRKSIYDGLRWDVTP